MFEKEAEKFMEGVFPYEDETPMYGEEQVKRLLSIFVESICNKAKKENRKVKFCYLCRASRPDFTVASKHLSHMLERFKKFDSGTSHITIHICEDCFLKIFDKGKTK